jgi:tetrahydromethanopterin S-methyltransferase subunit B
MKPTNEELKLVAFGMIVGLIIWSVLALAIAGFGTN